MIKKLTLLTSIAFALNGCGGGGETSHKESSFEVKVVDGYIKDAIIQFSDDITVGGSGCINNVMDVSSEVAKTDEKGSVSIPTAYVTKSLCASLLSGVSTDIERGIITNSMKLRPMESSEGKAIIISPITELVAKLVDAGVVESKAIKEVMSKFDPQLQLSEGDVFGDFLALEDRTKSRIVQVTAEVLFDNTDFPTQRSLEAIQKVSSHTYNQLAKGHSIENYRPVLSLSADGTLVVMDNYAPTVLEDVVKLTMLQNSEMYPTSITHAFSDIDNEITHYKLTSKGQEISGVKFNSLSGEFTGTPKTAGKFEYELIAVDEMGSLSNAVSLQFEVTAEGTNQPPYSVVSEINQTVTNGNEITPIDLSDYFKDDDSKIVKYDLTDYSNSGLVLLDNHLKGEPSKQGTMHLEVKALDYEGAVSEPLKIYIHVVHASSNNPPYANSKPTSQDTALTVNVNSDQLDLKKYFKDDDFDGDGIQIKSVRLENISGYALGLSVSPEGYLVGSPNWTGDFRYNLYAKDSNNAESNYLPIIFEVRSENRSNKPPYKVGNLQKIYATEGTSIIAIQTSNKFSDDDGSVVNYVLKEKDNHLNGLMIDNSGMVSGIPLNEGTYNYEIYAIDNESSNSELPLTLQVTVYPIDREKSELENRQWYLIKSDSTSGQVRCDSIVFKNLNVYSTMNIDLPITTCDYSLNEIPHAGTYHIDYEGNVIVDWNIDNQENGVVEQWVYRTSREGIRDYTYFTLYGPESESSKQQGSMLFGSIIDANEMFSTELVENQVTTYSKELYLKDGPKYVDFNISFSSNKLSLSNEDITCTEFSAMYGSTSTISINDVAEVSTGVCEDLSGSSEIEFDLTGKLDRQSSTEYVGTFVTEVAPIDSHQNDNLAFKFKLTLEPTP